MRKLCSASLVSVRSSVAAEASTQFQSAGDDGEGSAAPIVSLPVWTRCSDEKPDSMLALAGFLVLDVRNEKAEGPLSI